MATGNALADRFKQNGITRAAIIDDAYDTPPISDETRLDFWTHVSDDEELLAALHVIKPSIENEHGIDDEVIAKLWADFDRPGILKDICRETLFRDSLQRVHDLKLLDECLTELGICDVCHLGTQDGLPDNKIRLIFLDFSLDGHGTSVTEADLKDPDRVRQLTLSLNVPEQSRKMAENIWQNAGDEKPFLVLISDHREAGILKDRFLTDSFVLGGLFGFMAKSEFKFRQKVLLRLASWGIGSVECQQIQRFAAAAVESVDAVAKEFAKRIRSLDVHDYSHIQRIALSNEGHPLGDYMLGLFESLLSYQFRSNAILQQEQRKTDMLTFDHCIPCEKASVRAELAYAYWCAQTVPVGDVMSHPWDKTRYYPCYAMGDIFVKDETSPVFVLINAPCDLRFVPGKTSRRPWKSDLSLLLVPGKLISLEAPISKEDLVTGMFGIGENIFRIKWDVKSPLAIVNKCSRCFFNREGYKRVARLRTLYAMEIKMHFVAEISRLGTPVAPPLQAIYDLRVYLRRGKRYEQLGNTLSGGCVVFPRFGDLFFVLTTNAIEAILDTIQQHIKSEDARLVADIAGIREDDPYKENKRIGYQEKQAQLKQLQPDIHEWLGVTEKPITLPKNGASITIGPSMAKLFHLGQNIVEMANDTPIILDVTPASISCHGAGQADVPEQETPVPCVSITNFGA